MRTLNTYYVNCELLSNFIQENSIPDSKNVLVKVFTSVCDNQYISELIRQVNTLLPQAKMVGATTNGEINEGEVTFDTTVLSFLVFDSTEVKTSMVQRDTCSFRAGADIAKELDIDKAKVLILLSAGPIEGEVVVKGMESINENITLVGGRAGIGDESGLPTVFTEEGITSDGLVGAVLAGDELHWVTDYSFCWEPIGKFMTVTQVDNGRIYTIDDIHIVDVYKKYLGEEVAADLAVSVSEFPLLIQREDVLIARAAQAELEDGSVKFATDIRNGDKVRFGFGNVDNLIKKAQKTAEKLKQYPLESVFLYSCGSRKNYMGNSIEQETLPYKSVAPVSGFFTLGEFYHTKKEHLFLNMTMVLLGLYEGRGSYLAANISERPEVQHLKAQGTQKGVMVIRALTRLVNTVSDELNEKNDNLENKNRELTDTLNKLNNTQKQLAESEKMAALGLLVAGVAHEINTPVGIGITAASYLNEKITEMASAFKNGKIERSEFEKFITTAEQTSQIILANLMRAGELVRNFKQVAADRASEEKRSFNLKQYINSILISLKPEIRRTRHTIRVRCEEWIYLDSYPGAFSHIITNFIMNSLKYAFDDHDKGEIEISAEVEKEELIFKYSDNGKGITEEHQRRIFEPFFTTHRENGSTGLGLNIVYNVVTQQLGGTIQCESRLGEGTLFTITVPSVVKSPD